MRLLCNVHEKSEADKISHFLHTKGIDVRVDAEQNRDWGDSNYGALTYHVWIYEEDQAEKAYALYKSYLENPPALLNIKPEVKKTRKPILQNTATPITFYFLILCTLIFFADSLLSPEFKTGSGSQAVEPLYTSPVKKELLYDFPKAYEIMAELILQFGADQKAFSQELVQKLNETPYWQGFYEMLVSGRSLHAPLFEKIGQGQIWRLFSPILLHGDIFHLLFNMIWLYVLGMQLERHMGTVRYLSFILLTAAFTNTAQYLMSGPSFLGFSGVLCAMITYVYVRQRVAPWEGYQLQKSTFAFIMLFIFGMFALQLIAFLLRMTTGEELGISIANTAHISGAAIGVLLGITPFFINEKSGLR